MSPIAISGSGVAYLRVESDHDASSEMRASSDCVCEECGRRYDRHPRDVTEAHRVDAVHVLCDGTRVKL